MRGGGGVVEGCGADGGSCGKPSGNESVQCAAFEDALDGQTGAMNDSLRWNLDYLPRQSRRRLQRLLGALIILRRIPSSRCWASSLARCSRQSS